MDADEVALVRKTVAGLFDDPAVDVAAALDDMGWGELAAAEPKVATAELFGALGRANRASACLDQVVADVLGVVLTPDVAVLHPAVGAPFNPPGRVDGESSVVVDGVALGGARSATRTVVACEDEPGVTRLVTVELGALEGVAVNGVDASAGLVRWRGRVDAETTAAAAPWNAAAAAARRALAYELCGLGRAALERTVDYVTNRQQFGHPLATFQTTRHRLSDVHVALSAAEAVLDAAWGDDADMLCDAAKAIAGDAAEQAGLDCLQVTGAIGFTEEYDLAPRIRRAQLLNALYGSSAQLAAGVGAAIVARGVEIRPGRPS